MLLDQVPTLALPAIGGAVGATTALLVWPLLRRLCLGPRATAALLSLLVVAYCGVFCVFDLLHYQAMNSHQTDLALMDQMVWSTLHGQFMHTTLQGIGVDNFLAFHFEPIMALISPLYLLVPSAGVLVALQTLGFGVAAVPLALWARKRLDSQVAALLVALAFLLSPVLAYANDLLFEQIPLAVPLLSFAFYFQLNRRWRLFWLFALLALAVREEIAFVVMGMGLYALLVQRRRLGWGVMALGGAWAVLTLGVLIPHFNGGRGVYWAAAFGYLGAGDVPLDIARAAVTHPLQVLQHMASPPRPSFVLSLFLPLAFLPLLGWRVAWLALPTLAYLLLGDGYYDPNSWYPTPMLPFLYYGAVEGLAVLRRFVPGAIGGSFLAANAAVAFHLMGGGPGTLAYTPLAYDVTPHSQAAKGMLASIPAGASVSATPQIIAHASHRLGVSIFPELLIPRDFFAIDFVGWRGWHGYPAIYDEYDQAVRRVLHDPAYGAFYRGDGLLLLKRGVFPPPPTQPVGVRLGDRLELVGYDPPARIEPGRPLTVHLRWRAAAALPQQYTVSLQFGSEAAGKLAQHDGWPWDGYFPTIEWPANRDIDDPETVVLPASLPPGQYRLFVSVYSIENGQPRPLTAAGTGESGVSIGPFTAAG